MLEVMGSFNFQGRLIAVSMYLILAGHRGDEKEVNEAFSPCFNYRA
jgi:hypothetical protein